ISAATVSERGVRRISAATVRERARSLTVAALTIFPAGGISSFSPSTKGPSHAQSNRDVPADRPHVRELEVSLGRLVGRMPRLPFGGRGPARRRTDSLVFRGLESLPVRFD